MDSVKQVGPLDKHLRNIRGSLHNGYPSPQAEPPTVMKECETEAKLAHDRGYHALEEFPASRQPLSTEFLSNRGS